MGLPVPVSERDAFGEEGQRVVLKSISSCPTEYTEIKGTHALWLWILSGLVM